MRFAYADPPYLGCGRLYLKHHSDALIWDNPETHRQLIQRLCDEYPDGWALSLHEPSLKTLLPMCPDDVRVGAWCKTFAQIRPSDPQAFWEPIIWRGGRKERRKEPCRDWLSSFPARNGLIGSKPRTFAMWMFNLIGARRGDTLDDLFPGTGAIAAAWAEFTAAEQTMTAAVIHNASCAAAGECA
jgi:hypothetical protein